MSNHNLNELEASYLKSQGVTGNNLNELRLSFYNKVLGTSYHNVNEARQAWLKSKAGHGTSEPERGYLYARGVAHQNSIGDMWRSFYTGYGMIETAQAYWLASQKSGEYYVDLTGNGHDMRLGSVGSARVINKGRAKYLRLNGVSGNYGSTPNATQNQITDDITIDCKAAFNTYTSGQQDFLVKWGNAGFRSYAFVVSAGAQLQLVMSFDGTNAVVATSSTNLTAQGITAGTIKWFRASRQSSSGDVKFYTSDNGTTWTQFGTTQSSTTGAMFNASQIVEFGSQGTGTAGLATGRFYEAKLYNSYLEATSGTPALNPNFTNLADGTTSFTESSANAATVTINSTSGADTNDPLHLPFTGNKYARIPSAIGNYVVASSDAIPAGFNTVEFAGRVRLDTYESGTQYLGGWNSTHGNLHIKSTRKLNVSILNTVPATVGGADSPSALPTVSGWVWLRGRVTISDANCEYWYSTDDTDTYESVSWTSLGSAIGSNAGTTPIASSHQSIIGTISTGIAGAEGDYRRWIEVIDGTKRKGWNSANATEPFATQALIEGSSLVGNWTYGRVATGRKLAIVDRTMLLFGTDDYLEAFDQVNLNIGASQNFMACVVARVQGTTTNQVLIGKKSTIETSTDAGWILNRGSTANTPRGYISDATNATADNAGSAATQGVKTLFFVERNTTADTITGGLDGNSETGTTDTTTATLTNTQPLRIGASGGGANFADMVFFGGAVLRKTLTAAQKTQVKSELGG